MMQRLTSEGVVGFRSQGNPGWYLGSEKHQCEGVEEQKSGLSGKKVLRPS